MKVKALKASYETTTVGTAGSVAGIALLVMLVAQAVTAVNDSDPLTMPNWEAIGAALITVLNSFGLIAARDADTTSEESI